jgi:predicted DCC family thiol-disulfide oxidoreductase YuxK
VIQRLDSWLDGGDFTRTSLARYRIIFAAVYLLVLPDFSWVAVYADSMYNAPPGPFRLFSGFPPETVLRSLEALFAVCLVAILVGWHTRIASFAAVLIAMTGFGFDYGVGKIDHDILLVLIPAALAVAGWGDRLSVDAWRRRHRGETEPPERAEQWPLRLYVLAVGLAFLTAGLAKVHGDWLNPHSHAVQALEARAFFTHGRHGLLAGPFVNINNPVLWEALDIATILLEVGMVVAVLSWAGTRFGFAAASTFHLGVLFIMNIAFFMNVLIYGFVVRWDRVPVPPALAGRVPRLPAGAVRAVPLVVIGGGIGWSFLIQAFGNAAGVVYPAVLVAGGLIGGGYLVMLGIRLLRALRDPGDSAAGRLVYDPDCGFCTRAARWLARRRPDRVHIQPGLAPADQVPLGLTDHDIKQRAYWQDSSGALSSGSAAIAAALVARGGASLALGRLIGSPLVAPVAALVYDWVARHRRPPPDSTDARAVAARAAADDGHRADT